MTADELVRFAEELARVAAAGGGCTALAGVLAVRADVGVLVEDAQWRHLAAAGSGPIPKSVRGSYDRKDAGYAILTTPPGRTLCIGSPDKHLGQISVFGGRDLDDIEHLVRVTAATMSVELAREHGAQPMRQRVFWERLATKTYADAAAARDDAATQGIVPATHYLAIALEAEIAHTQGASRDHAVLRDAASHAFNAAAPDAGRWQHGPTLFFFVPAAREVDASNARTAAGLLLRKLAKTHPQLRAVGGVGSRAPLIALHESIAQARNALTISRRLYGGSHIGVHEELGAYPLLLSGADGKRLRDFAVRILTPLRAYDEKHQTELEKTLRCYFDVGENVKTAADRLCVHRHTVFYRLRQIGDICNTKLDDPHDQLTLRMAIAIDALTE